MEIKKFKCKDEVILKLKNHEIATWFYAVYSHLFDDGKFQHHVLSNGIMYNIKDYQILPYEGNEHLVGTTDSPDEEVELEEGEWVMFTNRTTDETIDKAFCYNLRQYCRIDDYNHFISKYFTAEGAWNFAVKFSDFNPNDMEETKKHILCVKNGKIVKYKIN